MQKRIRHACARCRHHKLKCDSERPCPLCVRSNVLCVEATERTRRSNRIGAKPRVPVGEQIQISPQQQDQTSITCNASLPDTPISPVGLPLADTALLPPARERPQFLQTPQPSSPTDSSGRRGEAEQVWVDQRHSAIHIVEKIFRKYRGSVPDGGRNQNIDAIPDGSLLKTGPLLSRGPLVPLIEVIGIKLPPPDVTRALVEAYQASMHWYFMVFHAPTFNEQLESILATGVASLSQRPFLLLVIIVLANGARFVDAKVKESRCRGVDLNNLQTTLIERAERWFLQGMEDLTPDFFAFGFLLSSYYFYSRNTKLAALTLSNCVHAARSVGLHQESSWPPNIAEVEREYRRRVWWCLFIGQGFVSMAYGSPPMIQENDCAVSQPLDLDDNTQTCPQFDSLELREDNEYWPVTIGSYHRYKASLYKIATSLMHDVYFTRSHDANELVNCIRGYHKRLLDWERAIPPELRVESHSGAISDDEVGPLRRLFALQSITLRITYDNVHLFLFRPFFTRDKGLGSAGAYRSTQLRAGNQDEQGRATPRNQIPSNLARVALNQCWTSAMRTSLVGQYPDVLKHLRLSAALVHVGVHGFSSGVMLGLLALSNPLSQRSQESKRGIARLIQLPSKAKFNNPVWNQMTTVLTDLLHIISAEETKALIHDQVDLGHPDSKLTLATFGAPPNLYPSTATLTEESQNLAQSAHGATTPLREEELELEGGQPPQVPSESIQCADPKPQGEDVTVETTATSELGDASLSFQELSPELNAESLSLQVPSYGVMPPTEWLGENMQGLAQMWMWDSSFSYL